MVIKKITLSGLIGLLLLIPATVRTEINFSFKDVDDNTKTAAIVFGVAAGALVGYKLYQFAYNKYKQYNEQIIIDKTVDALIVSCMPVSLVKKLSPKERDELLQKKAWLINIRKRILNKLEEIVAHDNNLSKNHKEVISSKLKTAKTMFAVIDTFKLYNRFENDYKKASYLDTVIENRIINSLIISLKPIEECMPTDLATKQEIQARRKKVIERVKSNANEIVVQNIVGLLALFSNNSSLN